MKNILKRIKNEKIDLYDNCRGYAGLDKSGSSATSKAEDNLPKIVCIQTNCDNPNNRNQNVTKLFDMDEQSKWYADKGFSGKFPCIILWEYDGALAVKSYSLTSGNDVRGVTPNRGSYLARRTERYFIALTLRTTCSLPTVTRP